MIRFVLGFLLLMGAVGGIEQDTAGLLEGMGYAFLGLALMVWALPKIIEQNA